MKTIDIAVIALRRSCFKALMESLEQHLDYKGYNLRLVLHVDYLDCYSTYDIEFDIWAYYHLFKEIDITIQTENVGHTQSWINIMKKIKNDLIFMEDDKYFYKPMSVQTLIDRRDKYGNPYDMISLEGFCGRIGSLESWYSKKKIIDYLLKSYSALKEITDDAEKTNKIFLKNKGYVYYRKNHLRCVEGTAMDNMAEHGLIRVRTARNINSPIYIPVPKNFSYIIHGGRSPRNVRKLRNFYLCLQSFPVFEYENMDVNDIKTSHVGIMSHTCMPFAKVTYQLDYSDIEKCDVSGCLDDSSQLFFIRTELFKEHYNREQDKSFEWIRFIIWSKVPEYDWDDVSIQDWGFNLA